MNNRIKGVLSGMALLAGAVALMAGLGSSEARAQMFEYTYGDRSNAEAGRGGVQAVYGGGGGYVAVGESFSPSGGATADIMVVRTHSDGSESWTRTYNLGGNDSATDIQEVRHDPDGNDGFIITGVTNASKCGTDRELFLLRLDMCGNVMWIRTYGQSGSDEIGWDVIEARRGSKKYGTSPGDFVVAGSTTFRDNCNLNGYLLRVNHRGDLIWDRFYDGPDNRSDYFYSLDECHEHNYDEGGDIVAAGGSNSYNIAGTGSYDAWVVRVHGGSGDFLGGNHGAAAYGREGFEELRSIIELKESPSNRGELVAAGASSSSSQNLDVLLIRTKPHPCELVNVRLMGDFGRLPDEAYCVREVPFDFNDEVRQGHVAVTGYLTTLKERGGSNSRDVFLQTFDPSNNLQPSLPTTMIYGGAGTDWGWSLAPVCPDKKWCEAYKECATLGFVIAGFTNSEKLVEPFDPQQLYLIKTNSVREDRCTSQKYEVEAPETDFERSCRDLKPEKFTRICEIGAKRRCWKWELKICLEPDGVKDCRIKECDCDRKDFESPAAEEAPIASAPETGAESFSMTSYPNPIKSGTMLNVEYNIPAQAAITVTVSDLAGKVVHTAKLNAQAGRGVQEVNTRNWPAGSYMVTVKSGENSETKRVVVVE